MKTPIQQEHVERRGSMNEGSGFGGRAVIGLAAPSCRAKATRRQKLGAKAGISKQTTRSTMIKTMRRQNLLAAALACGLAAGMMCVLDARAQNDERIGNEYRLTLFPYHKINEK